MNNYKYIYNIKNGTLHILNKCCFQTNIVDENKRMYKNEDQCFKENQSHFKKCRVCFRNK